MQNAHATLHIHVGDDTTHEVPADVLCRLLNSMQNLVHLTAAARTDRGACKRILGETSAIPKEYKLICELPQAGSYRLPIRLENVLRPLLNDGRLILLDTLLSISVLAAGGTLAETPLRDLSPDNRARFFQNLQHLIPSSEDSSYLTIDTEESFRASQSIPKEIKLTQELLLNAKDKLVPPEERPEQIMTVIGDLISVDFERSILSIRHSGTHKEITCSYRPEVVDQILQNRDSGILVTGTFTLDEDGNPKTLSNVTSIQPVDLTPINLDECAIGLTTPLRSCNSEPILLTPFLDGETRQYFIAECPELGIEAIAPTREGLIQEISQQLLFNWQQYAMESDDILTQSAQELKRSLRTHYTLDEETTNA